MSRTAGTRWVGVLSVLAGGAAVLDGRTARADETKLTIAIFAPNGAFESGEARYSFASKVAQQIAAAGVPAEPKAYARAGDFEAAVKKNQVDFAVVDGVYLAEKSVPWNVLATATAGGESSSRWALFAVEGGGVMDLQGKKLALASTAGRDLQFVENALLDGELPKFFGARQATPDIAAAAAAVSLKKAACVFAPESLPRGLRRIFEAGRVPNPAFVQIKSGLGADVVAKVKQAVVGGGGSGPYDGWRAASNDAYRALAARLGAKVRKPVMAEPDTVRLEDSNVLLSPALPPLLPELKDQFWTPSGTP